MSVPLVTSKPRLTATRARELFDYNPESGALSWKSYRGSRAKAGQEAGYVCRPGRTSYKRVLVDRVNYAAHRLAYLLYYGAWPSGEIDHIDGDGLNNRISNLRAVTRAGNARNHPRRLDNASGVTGVSWDRDRGNWQAQIWVGGKAFYVGRFDTIDDAARARKRAERFHGFHENHGRVPEGISHVQKV
jgi:hypothetical protein